MRAQVSRWGNSLALRIPGAVARELAMEEGGAVEITIDQGRLVIAPMATPVYDLRDLVRQMKHSKEQPEIDTGTPRGHEVW